MSERDTMADLRKWMERVKELPEPIAYIVLDHGWDARLPYVDGHDAQGRRYVLCSPAVLDEARHYPTGSPHPQGALGPLIGIPVHRRDQMPEGWPDSTPTQQNPNPSILGDE